MQYALPFCRRSGSQAGPGETQEKPEEPGENSGRLESGKLWETQGDCFPVTFADRTDSPNIQMFRLF